jgi:hypothetical protein
MSLDNCRQENNMTKWHSINWTLTQSYSGTEIDLKPGIANTFRFDPKPANGAEIVLYGMKSQPAAPPTTLKDAWLDCVLVPQRGMPIQGFLPENEPALDPTDETRVEFLVKRYRALYLEHLGDTFERLVGTVKFNNGTHHAVAFYQVPNVCEDSSKILLMSHVRFIGSSPGGVVAGNN